MKFKARFTISYTLELDTDLYEGAETPEEAVALQQKELDEGDACAVEFSDYGNEYQETVVLVTDGD